MLIDTHCHLNNMVKEQFDTPLQKKELPAVQTIIEQAQQNNVSRIINVGTSVPESLNSVLLAQNFQHVYATVGIHPNDCTSSWLTDFKEIQKLAKDRVKNKIVGIGECGMDFHYPDFNKKRQADAFKAHIELALEYDLALVVHSRDAYDETLKILQEYKGQLQRGTIHCFSYDLNFAHEAIALNFVMGIGGTITYPKNDALRAAVVAVDLTAIVLETDAPFLPIQSLRGKQNSPKYIKEIAEFVAQLRNQSFQEIAQQTTRNAMHLFQLPEE